MSHHPRGRRRTNDLEAPSEVDEESEGDSVAVTEDDPAASSVDRLGVGEDPASAGMRGRTFSVASGASAFQVIADAFAPVPRPEDVTETTPLLSEPTEASFWADLRSEVNVLARYSAPIVLTHLGEYSLLVVTVLSVGHIGTIELAASSIASMTGNVAGLSIIIGFASALDTLCPQAYTSSTPSLTSLWALRTQMILLVLLIPQFIIFWNAEPILLALRQDPRVAIRASQYLRCLSFGLPGYGVFEVARRWLQAQGLMSAPTACLIVVAPLNAVLNYLLVWGPDPIRLGFIGAPLATMVSFNLMGLLCVLYCVFIAPREAWGGFSRQVFRDLGPNIRLGLAGFAMVASEWWCWEIVGLASSQLGPTALAAQSVIVTISSLAYQFPYAVSAAAAVRIGNLLGAQKPRLTRVAFYASLVAAGVTSSVNVLVMVIFRDKWGAVFSSEEDVRVLVAKVLPLVAAFQVADSPFLRFMTKTQLTRAGTSGIAGGVLRGAGKAAVGALFMTVSYYLIGLPLGLVLTFSKAQLGLYGLWIGLTVALGCVASICVVYLWRLDYDRQALLVRQRMSSAKTSNGGGHH